MQAKKRTTALKTLLFLQFEADLIYQSWEWWAANINLAIDIPWDNFNKSMP